MCRRGAAASPGLGSSAPMGVLWNVTAAMGSMETLHKTTRKTWKGL